MLPDALEIVDNRNRPLLVMPCADALRQGLPHRAVALLPRLRREGFLLLRRGAVWDAAGLAPVPAGESAEQTAQNLRERLGLPPAPLRRAEPFPPDAAFPCFLDVFVARLHALPALPAAWEALPVDADALNGLLAMSDAPLSPLLRRIAPRLLHARDL